MSLYSDLKAALRAVDDIRGLQDRLTKLTFPVDTLSERLVRLEEREALLMERAQGAARDAAATAAQRMAETVFERVIRLEAAYDALQKRLPPPEDPP